VAAVVAVIFAAGGVAGASQLHFGHHAPRIDAVRNSGVSTRMTPPPTQGSGPAPSPSSPSPSITMAVQVTVSAEASQDPDAASVATFLDQFFDAINTHDYQSYMSLLTAPEQQGLTQEQFDNGYDSTTDSAVTLLSISTATDGDLVANVTFTSHQDPAASPNQQESCTDWNISLFLEQDGGEYLIDQPPPTYHATYAACQ
jgi:hypothetical protein